VDNTVRVKVIQARQQLLEYALNVGFLKGNLRFANGVKLMLRKFKNHKLGVLVWQPRIVRLIAHFHKLYNVGVRRQSFQKLTLPNEVLTGTCTEFPNDHRVILLVYLSITLGNNWLELRKALFVALKYSGILNFVEKLLCSIYLVVLT
jgi:hypothetical protein